MLNLFAYWFFVLDVFMLARDYSYIGLLRFDWIELLFGCPEVSIVGLEGMWLYPRVWSGESTSV